MSRPILRLKLDVTKIAKDALFRGKKGVYLDVALWASPKTFDDGDTSDGFATQELSKDRREAGEKGAILGNFKYLEAPAQPPPKKLPPMPADPDLDSAPDDIPF